MGDQAVLLFKPAGRVMDIPPILSTAELTATTSKIQGPVNGCTQAALWRGRRRQFKRPVQFLSFKLSASRALYGTTI